jgi:hypothetical protein
MTRQSTSTVLLTLDHDRSRCYVCRQLLADSGGNPSSIRESHHVVPRAYGGTDGPQVDLCIGHHDLIHLIATKKISKSDFSYLLPKDSTHMRRVEYLSEVILKSYEKFAGDSNKRVTITFSLSASETENLSALTSFLGVRRSELLRRLIQEKHQTLFPKKKI